MGERTRASIMQTYDSEVAALISKSRGITEMDALRLFLNSKTHEMLSDDEMKLWYFSSIVFFDIWAAFGVGNFTTPKSRPFSF